MMMIFARRGALQQSVLDGSITGSSFGQLMMKPASDSIAVAKLGGGEPRCRDRGRVGGHQGAQRGHEGFSSCAASRQ